jgi:hypothetical protein
MEELGTRKLMTHDRAFKRLDFIEVVDPIKLIESYFSSCRMCLKKAESSLIRPHHLFLYIGLC